MLKRRPLGDLTPGPPQHQNFWPQEPTWVMHLPWTHSQTQFSQQGRVWKGQAQTCVPQTPRSQDTKGEADSELGEPSVLLGTRFLWAGLACPPQARGCWGMAMHLPSETGTWRNNKPSDSSVL